MICMRRSYQSLRLSCHISHSFTCIHLKVTGYSSEEKLGKALEGADVVTILASVLTTAVGKNFMSPTISDSFKMAESPRKKILTERNESAPCSDPKVHVSKVTFADPLEQKSLDASFVGRGGIPFPCYESEDLSDETSSDSNVVPLIPMDYLIPIFLFSLLRSFQFCNCYTYFML